MSNPFDKLRTSGPFDKLRTSGPFDGLRTSGIEDELADALGAFKMQLDARPNTLSKRAVQPSGIVVRESTFGSQLPSDQRLAPEPPPVKGPCFGLFGVPATIVVTGVANCPGVDADANGVFRLQFSGFTATPYPEFGTLGYCSWISDDGDKVAVVWLDGTATIDTGFFYSGGPGNGPGLYSFGETMKNLFTLADCVDSRGAYGGTATMSFG